MFLSESEGTGITFSESEGTGISWSESEGTGINQISETEGTGILNKCRHGIHSMAMLGLFLFFMAPMAAANHAFIYASEGDTYQGIIVDLEGNSHLIEGVIENKTFEGFINESIINDEDKSVDDGTGNKSVDDGTGGKSVDDGTGGASVDDGTGLLSVDDGTGLLTVADGNSKLISISLSCNADLSFTTQVQAGNNSQYLNLDSIRMNGINNACKY